MNASTRMLLPFVVVMLLAPLTACALSGKAIEGQVLEEGTNKPIPDAIVVARWQGTYSAIAETRTVCYHVETATTDAAGRFRTPAWSARTKGPFFSPEAVIITAYKPGYEEYLPPGYAYTEAFKQNTRYLKLFTGGREERLKYLLHISSLVDCYGAGDEKSLVPVYKAIYDEAKAIATSEKDRDALQTIRRRALYAWSRPPRELTLREIEQAIQKDPYLREQFQ
jgi:hypothetical protein